MPTGSPTLCTDDACVTMSGLTVVGSCGALFESTYGVTEAEAAVKYECYWHFFLVVLIYLLFIV